MDMKWLLSMVFIIACSALFLAYDTYTVERVIDGDTLVVSRYGKEVSVRLMGIDAPEQGQCYYQKSADALREIVGGRVMLHMDDSQNAYDAYGRVLAYVYAGDLLVNKTMLEEGYAREYTYIIPYLYQDMFRSAEASAQMRMRGGWADCAEWFRSQCGAGMLCSVAE